MKRILNWLKAKFSRPTAPTVSDPTTILVSTDVLMPDIYGEKNEDTEPLLKILDPSSPDIDKSTGFDPYDTAVLKEK